MIVYRLEHKSNHRGPYTCGLEDNVIKEMVKKHESECSGLERPVAEEDGISIDAHNIENYRYGFKDLSDLLYWFHHYLDQLIKLEFEVVMYTIPDEEILIGELQIVWLNTIHDLHKETRKLVQKK